MAQKLAPLKQSSPNRRIRPRGSAAPEGGRDTQETGQFFKQGGEDDPIYNGILIATPKYLSNDFLLAVRSANASFRILVQPYGYSFRLVFSGNFPFPPSSGSKN